MGRKSPGNPDLASFQLLPSLYPPLGLSEVCWAGSDYLCQQGQGGNTGLEPGFDGDLSALRDGVVLPGWMTAVPRAASSLLWGGAALGAPGSALNAWRHPRGRGDGSWMSEAARQHGSAATRISKLWNSGQSANSVSLERSDPDWIPLRWG